MGWVAEISRVLNLGLLPKDFYSLIEQHAGQRIADVLTLHARPPAPDVPPSYGGTLVAEAPPRVRRTQTVGPGIRSRRRSIAIRHVSEHRLVALIEIISPSNKDRRSSVADFVDKIVSALDANIHALVLDPFPPGKHDPYGMHAAIHQQLEVNDEPDPDDGPPDRDPYSLVSYAAEDGVKVYLEHVKAGGELPPMPLFFQFDRYVNIPLQSTYDAAYNAMPEFWREVLEGKRRVGS